MECEESEQLKEISRFHLETPSHALRSLRKDGDYGEKTTSFPRTEVLESPRTEAQNLRGRRFRISEDGSLEPPRTEVQNLRGRRFRTSEDGGLESPRTEVQGHGVPEPQRFEDVEPEVPASKIGGLDFIEYELGTFNIPRII